MAVAQTITYKGAGIAEDFQDVIYDISPEETPILTACKRMKANNTYHQWQTDSLTAAGSNAQLEGLDATYATLTATTVLGNYTQISQKTVNVSGTYDVVKKYGRKSQVAYHLMKAGKELKRDMDWAVSRNQESTSGGASNVARTSAGIESWITQHTLGSGSTTGTTPGFASAAVAAPTDGSTGVFTEGVLKTALGQAWTSGGKTDMIVMSSINKALFSVFAGIATQFSEVKGVQQAVVVGAASIYVSDFGNHKVYLSRQVRNRAILCLDTEYLGLATLRPMQKQELAKTGDATKWLINTEYCLVVQNPNAHAKVASVYASD